MLKTNDDKELKGNNLTRWNGYINALSNINDKITIDDFKDIFNKEEVRLDWRQQTILYDHSTNTLYLDFLFNSNDFDEDLDYFFYKPNFNH